MTTSSRTMWVETIRRQLTSGQPMRIPCTPFAVRRPRREVGHNAGTYVKCELGDQTGWIEAVWWDAGKAGQIELERLLSTPVWAVEGTASLNRYGGRESPQVRLESVRAVVDADPLTLPGLLRRSLSSEAQLGDWLSGCIAEIDNLPLRRLLEDCLSEGGSWRLLYLRAPAGLFYHHAYVGGLVDHVREMASTWLAALDSFPRVDRDLTLAGIILHDVGKLDTFSPGHVPQLARAGRYMDHITAGIARLTRAIDAQSGFPPLLREQLLHIVASHHGEKEHGSPVIPATREAIVVHQLDRLSSLLSHFEEWANQSVTDQHGWSTEPSPWLKVPLANSPEIPDGFAEADSVR
ncbi:MAG: HD domain-containing protein [Chloroflexota bacterium]